MNKIVYPFMRYHLSIYQNKINFIHKFLPELNYSLEDNIFEILKKSKLNYIRLSGVEKVYYKLIMNGKIKTFKDFLLF